MLRFALSMAFLAGACSGGSGGDGPDEPDADLGLREFTITNTDASGELHSLTITCENLQSSAPIALVTDGEHQHTIRLEVVYLDALRAGNSVTLTFTEGHEHSFISQSPQTPA